MSRTSILVAAVMAIRPGPGDPSPTELIAMAPVLNSALPKCRNLDVVGSLGNEIGPDVWLRFQAFYRAPDRYTLLLCDPIDGTPVIYCSDGKMFCYDPAAPTLICGDRARCIVQCYREDRKFRFSAECEVGGTRLDWILIDLAGLLQEWDETGEDVRNRVVRHRDGRISLTSEVEDFALNVAVDPARRSRYTAFKMKSSGVDLLDFDRLACDEDASGPSPPFPPRESLARILPIMDVPTGRDSARDADLSARLKQAISVRSILARTRPGGALASPPEIRGVDWARVRENDRKLAGAVRDLIPPRFRGR